MPIIPKKLFLALALAILITTLLLARQIKNARLITIKMAEKPLVSPVAVALPTTPADPLLGNPGAPMTVVVFGDLFDAKTRSLLAAVINFVGKHPAVVRLIFKPTPEEHIWGGALLAHKALWCAASGRKFWPLLQALTAAPNIGESALAYAAKSAGLDDNQLLNCTRLASTKQAVLSATTIARDSGITVTPALFINNKQINLEEEVDVEQMLTTFIQP